MVDNFLAKSGEVIDYIGDAYLTKDKVIYHNETLWKDEELTEIYLDDVISIGYTRRFNLPIMILGALTVFASVYASQFFPIIAVVFPFLAGFGSVIYAIFTMSDTYVIKSENPGVQIKLDPNQRSEDFLKSVKDQRDKLREADGYRDQAEGSED